MLFHVKLPISSLVSGPSHDEIFFEIDCSCDGQSCILSPQQTSIGHSFFQRYKFACLWHTFTKKNTQCSARAAEMVQPCADLLPHERVELCAPNSLPWNSGSPLKISSNPAWWKVLLGVAMQRSNLLLDEELFLWHNNQHKKTRINKSIIMRSNVLGNISEIYWEISSRNRNEEIIEGSENFRLQFRHQWQFQFYMGRFRLLGLPPKALLSSLW